MDVLTLVLVTVVGALAGFAAGVYVAVQSMWPRPTPSVYVASDEDDYYTSAPVDRRGTRGGMRHIRY